MTYIETGTDSIAQYTCTCTFVILQCKGNIHVVHTRLDQCRSTCSNSKQQIVQRTNSTQSQVSALATGMEWGEEERYALRVHVHTEFIKESEVIGADVCNISSFLC